MSIFINYVYIKIRLWDFSLMYALKLKLKGGDKIRFNAYQKHRTLWFLNVYCKVYKIIPYLNIFALNNEHYIAPLGLGPELAYKES